jgi:hypothetical protein
MSGDTTSAVQSATTAMKKILASTIATISKGPLIGTIELRTEGGPIELRIDEDAALSLRTDLERFLTQ